MEYPKRKCDVCNEDAEYFASPLGNPDEPAYCRKHFIRYCEMLRRKGK
jgi:hypothetical protein